MDFKNPKLHAQVMTSLVKVDLGTKTQDGESIPVYKLNLESVEMSPEAMHSLFGMHRKNALVDFQISGATDVAFKGFLQKVNIVQKKSGGDVYPVYKVNLEIPFGEMDTEIMTLLFKIHRKGNVVEFAAEWTDPQLAMDFAVAPTRVKEIIVDVNSGEIVNSTESLATEDAIQFFDEDPDSDIS